MRLLTLAGLGLMTLAGALARGDGAVADEPKAPPPDPLVVHEWGTFTSMSGALGVALDGLQHEEEELPAFVYSRSEVRECPLRKQGYKGLEVPVDNVTHKMETPVIYVHTKSARTLRVRVDFVNGLISQWYPVTDLLGPPEGACDAGPLDFKKVERSFLEWDVDALAKDAVEPAEVPEVGKTDPWGFAREVDAAWLKTRPRQGERMGPVEAERYLFYRGLGRLELPFRGKAAPDGVLLFANGSSQTVAYVVGLEVGPNGKTARYHIADRVPAGGEARIALAKRSFVPIDEVLPGLEADMQKLLRSQGLFEDEARAMVLTWSRSWFRNEGVRLIYLVPREVTDQVLPLKITPQPDALVRVLVGRLELIPGTMLAEVEAALLDASSDAPARRDAGEARLARLGRFLEPHLRNVVAETTDPAVKRAAEARLDAAR